jgi:hypothetical protein
VSQHTPGPFFTSCPHGGTVYIEARLRGSTIQEVAAVGPTESPEQQQANAKLFAAAPDLLEALEDLYEAYGRSVTAEDWDLGASRKAGAAIAKAIGK